jgi:DNA-binding XRE family transcriptional regulator
LGIAAKSTISKEADMDRIQIISTPSGEKLAIMPLDEYERLSAIASEHTDDAEDERDSREARKIKARIKAGKEPLIPADVVEGEVLHGAHPVRAWREYRGLTAEKLAKMAGIARPYLTQIENGKRKGPVAVYKKLAKALNVQVQVLIN